MTIIECDKCGASEEPMRSVTMEDDQMTRTFDLCNSCGEDLEAWIEGYETTCDDCSE